MTKVKDGTKFASYTESMVFFQGYAFFSFLILLSSSIIAEFNASVLTPFCIFIAASLFIFWVVSLCKSFLDFVHDLLKVEELIKYRNDYLIAFSTIGICSIVLRIVVYFIERPVSFFFTTHYYVITTSSIYYYFVYPTFNKKCTWKRIDQETCNTTTVVSHIILSFISCLIATEYDETMMKTIIVYQFGCSLASAITFAEFARAWWAGLQLINVEGEVTKGSVPISAANTLASSCKICFIPYTENGIHCPRMIKECGHTVCELCVDNLLKVKDYTSLECPFCRKVTDVNGPAEMLPKNFALLEQMAEMKQGPI